MKFVSIANAILLCGLLVAVVAGAVAPDQPSDRLTLVSPNGKHRIDIHASDSIPGIWISRDGMAGAVSLYCSPREGSVVGVRGGRGPAGALDAAIASQGPGKAQLHLIDH